ncbi:ParB/RepB/Spo0J family partition protein [Kutzneria sp. CA-103260]|uniref:ParB/RepB/Spo0J family partition protein n=1 Tax=Kutzneria sp. CA-103260 TaxID=2802641 RepID=UPI0020132F19|nr:ParB/RepB/Spo0J family partition protein [Kutzneria sp. CA-103260]
MDHQDNALESGDLDFGPVALSVVERCSTAVVPIASLRPPDSPRLAGENDEHVRLLADSPDILPPIIVCRRTMRVIDGAHRVRAAVMRGDAEIEVRYFDGGDADAFLLAVQANTTHGMPLSRADRTAATARILQTHPHLSDRVIASTTGLSPKTVSAIRRRATAHNPQLRTRTGRDGRVRPLDTSEGRRRAADLISAHPEVSLRQVAAMAGISEGTARDVRDRLARGQAPVPEQRGRRHGDPEARADRRHGGDAARLQPANRESLMRMLKQDPSLRFNEAGRALIRLLDNYAISEDEQKKLIDNVPAHCVDRVAALARECASVWAEFAENLSRNKQS